MPVVHVFVPFGTCCLVNLLVVSWLVFLFVPVVHVFVPFGTCCLVNLQVVSWLALFVPVVRLLFCGGRLSDAVFLENFKQGLFYGARPKRVAVVSRVDAVNGCLV